jgi:hypothetical protein
MQNKIFYGKMFMLMCKHRSQNATLIYANTAKTDWHVKYFCFKDKNSSNASILSIFFSWLEVDCKEGILCKIGGANKHDTLLSKTARETHSWFLQQWNVIVTRMNFEFCAVLDNNKQGFFAPPNLHPP